MSDPWILGRERRGRGREREREKVFPNGPKESSVLIGSSSLGKHCY